jgi:phosphatidylserine/phosphatidylglycerophosphate/cardiolipin synthase-like enzyme
MTQGLARLSTADLSALTAALRTSRLAPPYNSLTLQSLLPKEAAAAAVDALRQYAASGFTPAQIASTIDLLIADRASRSPLEAGIELVTTGPDAHGVVNRDTSVVVRDLFASAEHSVLVAGYAIYQGQQVFAALADRMQARPDLNVRLFLDIQRGPGDTSAADQLIRRFAERIRTQQWPSGRPVPPVYCDPRSVEMGRDKRACLHAKCIVVDCKAVFISSANFTEAAQHRNIEVGLLIRDQSLAEKLTRFFDAMLHEGLLVQIV